MKCPNCNHEWKLPGPQAGGRAKVKKGFAMGQPSAAARKRAWKTRKRISDLEDKLKHAERIGGFSFSPNPEGLRTRHLVAGTQHPLVVAPNLAEKKIEKGC